MTHRRGNIVVIEVTPAEKCARCCKLEECRDVLGDGTRLCFGCATEKELEAYGQRLFGVGPN